MIIILMFGGTGRCCQNLVNSTTGCKHSLVIVHVFYGQFNKIKVTDDSSTMVYINCFTHSQRTVPHSVTSRYLHWNVRFQNQTHNVILMYYKSIVVGTIMCFRSLSNSFVELNSIEQCMQHDRKTKVYKGEDLTSQPHA